MILQALNSLYDQLVGKGYLQSPGWQQVNVYYGLQLNDEGELVRVIPLMENTIRGKKEIYAPKKMFVPEQGKRAMNILPYFLCDNSSYILGIDQKGKPERTRNCFEACRDYHIQLLSGCDDPAAKAIMRFFRQWKPEDAGNCVALDGYRDEVTSGGNLVFMYATEFAQDIPALKRVWEKAYSNTGGGPEMPCLVTGEREPIAVLHPVIKRVRGGQATGTSLVSFNARASESYGHYEAQGANAPVSKRAAFAYGAALNWLVDSEENHTWLGDTTVVFWAEDAEPVYSRMFGMALNGVDEDSISPQDFMKAMHKLAEGEPADWNGLQVNPNNRFYILGVAPNVGRLLVRFFISESFGTFAGRMQEHYDRLEIVRPSYDTMEPLPMWKLISESVKQSSRDKSPISRLSGEMLRSVLSGLPYPETLYIQIQLRIRAGEQLTRCKAAIVKAYLLRNTCGSANYDDYKDVLSVKLNENSNYVPYLLGRLFSVLEGLQLAANPGINVTIRASYFNSASCTPAIAFPQLICLAQAYLEKLRRRFAQKYKAQIGGILSRIINGYPAHLNLQDQGVFQLGYYHQTQKRFEKKEVTRDAGTYKEPL